MSLKINTMNDNLIYSLAVLFQGVNISSIGEDLINQGFIPVLFIANPNNELIQEIKETAPPDAPSILGCFISIKYLKTFEA